MSPPDFSPPEHIVIVIALFYASLGVMILAAFIAMLIKSWVRDFDRGLRVSTPCSYGPYYGFIIFILTNHCCNFWSPYAMFGFRLAHHP